MLLVAKCLHKSQCQNFTKWQLILPFCTISKCSYCHGLWHLLNEVLIISWVHLSQSTRMAVNFPASCPSSMCRDDTFRNFDSQNLLFKPRYLKHSVKMPSSPAIFFIYLLHWRESWEYSRHLTSWWSSVDVFSGRICLLLPLCLWWAVWISSQIFLYWISGLFVHSIYEVKMISGFAAWLCKVDTVWCTPSLLILSAQIVSSYLIFYNIIPGTITESSFKAQLNIP